MKRYRSTPTPWFWNCLGIALVVISIGIAWSFIQSVGYKVGTANHYLEVNRKLEEAKRVNSDIANDVKRSPIDTPTKLRTLRKLKKSQDLLEETSTEINQNQQELLDENPLN